MDAQRTEMMTRAGVRVIRTATPFDPAELGRIAALADERRGGVMSSGMEYPGRYSRWHMAYADPCAEIAATGRRVTARALNDRGRVLLPVIRAALLVCGEPVDEDTVVIPEDDREFTEEERSRRPTVFTALREVVAALRSEDPHLGLYGAFGYDLAFQFEPVTAAARPTSVPPPSATWSCTCRTRSRWSTASARGGPVLLRVRAAGAGVAPAAGHDPLTPQAPARLPARSVRDPDYLSNRGRAATRGSWRRPGSGSPAGTCSR